MVIMSGQAHWLECCSIQWHPKTWEMNKEKIKINKTDAT